jgi:hypothetical protein
MKILSRARQGGEAEGAQCNGAPPRHAILRAPPAGGIL